MARPEGKDRGLFERPKDSGVWWIRWADQFGKEHREKAGSKSAARALYQSRKTDVLQGAKLPALGKRELTLADLVKRYLDEIRSNKKSADSDERIAKLWVQELGSEPIGNIRSGDLERIKSKWLQALKPGTVNRRLAFLKTLFGKAVRDDLTDRNPLSSGRVKMMKENPAEKPIITAEQEAAILEHLTRPDQLAVLFALHTGLRISEQLERKRKDLSLERRSLVIADTKGGGRQIVHLNDVALSIARELLADRASVWLFPDGPSEPLKRNTLSTRFSRACKAARLEGVVWHCLRHTFISRLVMLGVPIVTVQKLARHKSIQMTLRYAHLYPEHTADAMANLASSYAPTLPLFGSQPAPESAPTEKEQGKSL
jgi:integrase